MKRRSFLNWSMSLTLASLTNGVLITRAIAALNTPGALWRRARPGDASWPASAAWEKLKQAVNGNLIKADPLFAPCVSEPAGPACKDALQNMRNPFYIGDQPGGTQVSGWLNAWMPEPSVYAIKAQSAADVAAGVNFARENKLRLVVKGAGHSYQGTSNAPDSLLIWTRAMNQVTLHEHFVPTGGEGKIAPVSAVTSGAGAVWIDLYHAVTTVAGRYVQGGGCTDVGVAGLIQSGGFGSFSKGFGSAASNLLEAEIVTADGLVRVANPHTNPDLFWAIKGGGGGSWGVVTKVTLRTYALPEYFGAAWGKIKADSDASFQRLIAHFLDFYASNLFNPHWGEQVTFAPDNTLKISMVCQGLDGQQAKRIWQPFFDWVNASSKDLSIVDDLSAGESKARHWWEIEGNHSMIPDKREAAPKYHGWWTGDQDQVGVFLHGYDSLWLPSSLLESEHRQQFVHALFQSSRHKNLQLHFNKGLAGALPETIKKARDTATNPAVCNAFALVIIADGEKPAYPGLSGASVDVDGAVKDAGQIDLAAQAFYKIVPNAGSYVSESNYFNPDWQQAFWGENYSRLQTVKKKYDPDGLFFVHHGVGSEEWSADGFTRISRG
ncbi:FAD-binding oxidoreductase [Collimonas pratensis]|uniref:FAD binding domain protein n=1 Tax=Collimonas pratensis TaxID=279113 RepID=A0ABN4M888_9BURK|nr:FAD-binding oxidoreductase [Collimonas pratensis]AMP13856.1 FAD binding domain protein [Collimonas pratensis]